MADPTVKPHPPRDGWAHNAHIIAGGVVVPVVEREEEEVGEDERPASERKEIGSHPRRNKLRGEGEEERGRRERGSCIEGERNSEKQSLAMSVCGCHLDNCIPEWVHNIFGEWRRIYRMIL